MDRSGVTLLSQLLCYRFFRATANTKKKKKTRGKTRRSLKTKTRRKTKNTKRVTDMDTVMDTDMDTDTVTDVVGDAGLHLHPVMRYDFIYQNKKTIDMSHDLT